jgi:hypothetical protein
MFGSRQRKVVMLLEMGHLEESLLASKALQKLYSQGDCMNLHVVGDKHAKKI